VPEVAGVQTLQATAEPDMKTIVVEVDIAKRVFQMHWVEAQVDDYHQQLARVLARAVSKNRTLVERKTPGPGRRKPRGPVRRRPSSRKSHPALKSKRRARR
jgi:hypothetical protein